jgi:hypothetical protein
LYEYKVVRIKDTFYITKTDNESPMEASFEPLEDALNKYAEDGWELYLIHGSLNGIYFFRRIRSVGLPPFNIKGSK